MTDVERLKVMIDGNQKIAVFTGAGISTESGIPDYRSLDGMWQNQSLVSVMRESYLHHAPKEFWPIFREKFLSPEFLNAEPNLGHQLIAKLETMGKDVTVITQNVDGLHQKAGSVNVLEVHGTIKTFRCPRKHHRKDIPLEYVLASDIPRCDHVNERGNKCDMILYPNVVLFDQTVQNYWEAVDAVEACDLMLVMGTSLDPDLKMSHLPKYASGIANIVIINMTSTPQDGSVELVIHGKISEVLSQVIEGD